MAVISKILELWSYLLLVATKFDFIIYLFVGIILVIMLFSVFESLIKGSYKKR